jgi:hypothetical protein
MSIQNELTKLYKKLSEEGWNKEAQRLTPFIKESQFFTFLRPKHNQALRRINRAIRRGDTGVAEAELTKNLSDLITDEQLMDDLKKNLNQGDAGGRRKFMKMLKVILKVLKAGGNVTLQTVKQEAGTDAPAQETPAQETPAQETPAQETPAQAPEDSTETEESRETETTTELKAVPTSEEGAIGDKNYKYFYNADKKGFQVAKESNTSVGAIIKAKNAVPGVQKEYNDKLDKAYAIIYNMFKDKGYNINKIPTPEAEAKYTGPASDVKYAEWKPESVGLNTLHSTVDVGSVKYFYYTLGSTNVTNTDLDNYETTGTNNVPLIAIKKSDFEGSRKTKVKDYFNPVKGSGGAADVLTPAEVTITPGTDGTSTTYEWKKK